MTKFPRLTVFRVVHTRSYGEPARTKIHAVCILRSEAFRLRSKLSKRGQTAWVEEVI